MLHYAVVFFVIALIAALFGFSGLAAGAAGIAKILFVVFLVVAVVSLLLGRRAPVLSGRGKSAADASQNETRLRTLRRRRPSPRRCAAGMLSNRESRPPGP